MPGETPKQYGDTDVQRTLEALRQSVRREAGYMTGDDVPAPAVSSAIAEAVDLSVVSAHLPVRSNVPVIGGAVSFVKRLLRLSLRWYINPIVEQQNAFNDAVVRALVQIERRQSRIERQLDAQSSQNAGERG